MYPVAGYVKHGREGLLLYVLHRGSTCLVSFICSSVCFLCRYRTSNLTIPPSRRLAVSSSTHVSVCCLFHTPSVVADFALRVAVDGNAGSSLQHLHPISRQTKPEKFDWCEWDIGIPGMVC